MLPTMLIKNKPNLITTNLRKQTLDIVEAGINQVLPVNIIKSAVKYDAKQKKLIISGKSHNLPKGRLFIIGGGKAAGQMAETLEKVIGPKNITAGVVMCNSTNYKTKKINIIEASHPVPDQRSIKGVKQMLALKNEYNIDKEDLIICLISGGGSALMTHPVKGINLSDLQKTTKLLLTCGAEIHEINAIRKHLSTIKGGQLGQYFLPTKIISLIISDVIGNDLHTIASGPTSPDPSSFFEAYIIFEKYGLLDHAPKNVLDYLQKGCEGLIEETTKVLPNCSNYIIGDNQLALNAMAKKAKNLGLKPYIATSKQKGDPVKISKTRAREIMQSKYKNYNVILIGGETTLKLPKFTGQGGRNQHYALATILAMQNYKKEWAMASLSTDGNDFLSDTAGAIVDNNSMNAIKKQAIDPSLYLNKYDSHTFFTKIGNSLITTGATGTNVGDVMVYVLACSL